MKNQESPDRLKCTKKKENNAKDDDIIYQDDEITEYDEYVVIRGNKL